MKSKFIINTRPNNIMTTAQLSLMVNWIYEEKNTQSNAYGKNPFFCDVRRTKKSIK